MNNIIGQYLHDGCFQKSLYSPYKCYQTINVRVQEGFLSPQSSNYTLPLALFKHGMKTQQQVTDQRVKTFSANYKCVCLLVYLFGVN